MATSFTLILLFIILLLFAGRLIFRPTKSKQDIYKLAQWPFEPISFMTTAEVRFYAKLRQLFPKTPIFAQVQLSRIIQPLSNAERHWLGRIDRMSVDYVIIDLTLQIPVLVIELDDWSHDHPDRVLADTKKDKALKSAGIPIVRFDGRSLPKDEDIKKIILKAVRSRKDRKIVNDLSVGY